MSRFKTKVVIGTTEIIWNISTKSNGPNAQTDDCFSLFASTSVCVRVCECVRACVSAYVHACLRVCALGEV